MSGRLLIVLGTTLLLSSCDQYTRVNQAYTERTKGEDKWIALAPDIPVLGLFRYEDERVVCYVYEYKGSALQCFPKN